MLPMLATQLGLLVAAGEIVWSAKPEVFAVWAFVEYVCQHLYYIYLNAAIYCK